MIGWAVRIVVAAAGCVVAFGAVVAAAWNLADGHAAATALDVVIAWACWRAVARLTGR